MRFRQANSLSFSKMKSATTVRLRTRAEIERLQLFEPRHQKCELRLKRGAALAFVKRMEKRIRFRLHDPLRIQPLGQDSRQRALADPDGTFHSNIPGKFKKIGHGLERCTRNWQDISDDAEWQLREELTGIL